MDKLVVIHAIIVWCGQLLFLIVHLLVWNLYCIVYNQFPTLALWQLIVDGNNRMFVVFLVVSHCVLLIDHQPEPIIVAVLYSACRGVYPNGIYHKFWKVDQIGRLVLNVDSNGFSGKISITSRAGMGKLLSTILQGLNRYDPRALTTDQKRPNCMIQYRNLACDGTKIVFVAYCIVR